MHIACMHEFVGACMCVCVCLQMNVIILLVFLYCSPEYEMSGVTMALKGLVTEGIMEINHDHNSKQQAAMTLRRCVLAM